MELIPSMHNIATNVFEAPHGVDSWYSITHVHNISAFYFYSLVEFIPGVRNIAAYDFNYIMGSIACMRNIADYDFNFFFRQSLMYLTLYNLCILLRLTSGFVNPRIAIFTEAKPR